MTPAAKMIHVSPGDGLFECLSVMRETGVRHLPVLSNNSVHGILTAKDIVSVVLEPDDTDALGAGKVAAMQLQRVAPDVQLTLRGMTESPGWALDVGMSGPMPHPDKTVAEDACFVRESDGTKALMMGVADGVGSWVQYGVDPSLYSMKLMQAAHTAAAADAQSTPLAVMSAAWSAVSAAKVVGSSTCTIVSVDPSTHTLVAANVGDSGFLVAREVDHERSGTLERHSHEAVAGLLRVVFRSPQQLHGFNYPFQMGVRGVGVCV
jgi:CBS domain-containing protein